MFIAEDGTGVVDANSYASTGYADAYFSDRANVQWASLTPTQKESALIAATDYISLWYDNRFKGFVKTETQGLQWPRVCTGLPTELPSQLLKATCEYAVRASVAPLNADVIVGDSGQMVLKTVERVGPIEEELTFQDPTKIGFIGKQRPIPAADQWMKFLLKNIGGGVIRN